MKGFAHGMDYRMRRVAAWLTLVILPGIAIAQRNEIPARVAMKDASGQPEVLLTGRRNDTLYARLADGAGGSITYQVSDIKRITLRLSAENIGRAEAAAASGNTTEAVRIMRGVIQPAAPYLDLPVDGVIPHAVRYAEWLRREKAWSAALSIYRAMSANPDQAVRDQAAGWMAYCHARSQQFKEAQELLASFTVDDPRKDGFMPGMLAGAMVKAQSGDDAGALDLAARAAALSRIDHELYPEAVFLAGNAYQRLATMTGLEEKRPDVILRKASDESRPVAPMTAAEFTGVATNMYAHMTNYFPASPFAAEAAKKLDDILKAAATNQPSAPPSTGAIP